MKHYINIISVLIAFTCYPLLASALEAQTLKDELKYLKTEFYTITASKVLERVDKSIATVTVIKQQQIQQMGARSLMDVLRVVPGIGITQSEFGFHQIEARGVKTEFSEKVLIMLNGHPLDHNLTNAGSMVVYDDLPMNNINRIEIVRGTGSALYGSNAFLAVINIITQTPEEIDGAEITVSGGSFDTQNYNISYGKDFKGLKIGGNFNYSDTQGIDAFIKQDATGKSGYTNNHRKNYDLSWDIAYDELKLDGRFINKKSGAFIGLSSILGTESKQDWNDYFLRLTHTHQFNNDLTLTSKVAYSHFSFDNIWQLAPNFFFKTAIDNQRMTGETQLTYKINDNNTFIFGFSAEQQKQSNIISQAGISPSNLSTTALWTKPTERFLWSLYTQDVWDIFDNLRLVAGVRFDHYSDFGSTFNPRLGLNWEFMQGYSLRFSYASAFRAPSFGETTLIDNSSILGNPNLSAESVETFEVGLTAHITENLHSQITLYHSDIEDIINLQPISPTISRYENNRQATTRGIEFETKYNFSQNTYLAVNYVYQDAKDGTHYRLADSPQHRANIMANIELTPQLNFYADLLLKGNTSRVLGDNRQKVAGYGIINTTLTVKDIGFKGWQASFSISNLFDKKYSDSASSGVPNDLPQAERAFFGTLRFKF